MANETIIKALQRTKDDNGELHPIFPYTSADAVLWDVNKNQTLEDKIIGGVVDNSNTVVYNDIFTVSENTESSGILKLDLPMGADDVDITAEIDVNSVVSRNHVDLVKYNVDDLYTDRRVKIVTVSESSKDGLFMFVASKYSTGSGVPAPKLYRVGNGVAQSIPITLRSIQNVVRVRFSKNGGTMIVFGTTTSDSNPVFEFYSVTSSNNIGTARFLFSHTNTNENATNIFFDTMVYNGTEYLIRTKMAGTTGPSLEAYTFNGSLVKSTAVTCTNTYNIENDFRISPDSKYIAILSKDGSRIATMGLNSGVYSSRTNTPFTGSGTYGGTGSSVGTGQWVNFNFGPDGRRLYGMYKIGLSVTVRVCNITNQYGDKLNITDEMVYYIDSDTDIFPSGVVNVCPMPLSTTFGNANYINGADFICVGSGGGAPSLRASTLPNVVRINGLSLTTDESSMVYDNGTVTDTTPRLRPSVFTKYEPELTLFNVREIINVCVSSYTGFGIGVRSSFIETPVIPMDFRTFKPVSCYTSNPVAMPIDFGTQILKLDANGNSIVHSNSVGNMIYAAIKSGNTYFNKIINAHKLYTFIDNNGDEQTIYDNIYDVTSIADGEIIIVYYKNSQPVAFRYNGTSYQPFNITASVAVPELPGSRASYLLQSSVTNNNGVYSWTSVIAMSERMVILKYVYNSQKPELSMEVYASTIAPGVLNIISASLSGDGSKICVLASGSGGVSMLYGFTYVQNNVSTSFTKTLDNVSTSARIELNYNGSLLAYTTTGQTLNLARLDWGRNVPYIEIPVTSGIPTGSNILSIKYANKAKRFYVFTSIRGIYIYDDNTTNITLFDRANVEYLNNRAAVSEDGSMILSTRQSGIYGHGAIYRINSTRLSGTITVSGKLTADGWKNVYIQSSNPNLKNITSLGYDAEFKNGVVLIGDTSTVWSPLYANIKKIIITGPGSNREAYKTNYFASVISGISSDIIHITKSSESETDETLVRRVQMKSHIIDVNGWMDTRSSLGVWTYRIYNDNININSTVNIDINDIGSMMIANTAGMLNVSTEYIGYVDIFSVQKPVSNITANINIFN